MEKLITVSVCFRITPGQDAFLLASYFTGQMTSIVTVPATAVLTILRTRLTEADMKLELSAFLMVPGINC